MVVHVAGEKGCQVPTRPTKGDHGTADAGSKERGGQKATYGSAVSPEVAAARDEALDDGRAPEDDGDQREEQR